MVISRWKEGDLISLESKFCLGINERRPRAKSGSLHLDRTDTLLVLVERRPCVQIHPDTVVARGQIIVLVADNLRPQASRAVLTRIQCRRSSSGVSPPQYRPSASFIPKHSWRWSPKLFQSCL